MNNNLEWVECPHCDRKLFKGDLSHEFDIEIKCQTCKGIYRIVYDGNGKYETSIKDRPKWTPRPTEFK